MQLRTNADLDDRIDFIATKTSLEGNKSTQMRAAIVRVSNEMGYAAPKITQVKEHRPE